MGCQRGFQLVTLSNARGPINRFFQGLAVVFEKLGFTPNGVSFLAILVTFAGAWMIAIGWLLAGALVAGVGGALDLFDGALARRTGQVTAFGGYLDAMLDRFADAALFLAVGWHYRTDLIWLIVGVAYAMAVITSYAKARAYQIIDVPNDAWPDLVERGERLIGLLVATGLQGISNMIGFDVQFLPWIVGLLGLAGLLTVVQRMSRAKQFMTGGGDA